MTGAEPPSSSPRVGVLLVNLGSPSAPTAEAVRTYLAQFLSDPLVVDWPRWIWKPVLHGIILRTRPARVAQNYARVWTDEGPPLVAITAAQADRVAAELGPGVSLRWAMRYGAPDIDGAVRALAAEGLDRLVLLPLFPQRADATTESVEREVEAALVRSGWSPELTVLDDLSVDPLYIEALAASVEEADADYACDRLIISYHGLPVRRGASYAAACEATTRALCARLGWAPGRIEHCYQSRFGPERWLGPATDERARALAPTARRLLVLCPGFTADCLETLDEIGIELAEQFVAAGGEELRLVPGLNLRPDWIECMLGALREAVS
jgi:ferrochelatase